jgi:hypothetical protein
MDTRDGLFRAMERFIRDNASLVADARDTNQPWNLIERLDRFKQREREEKHGKHRGQ